MGLFRVFFGESCWFKVTLGFLLGWLLGFGFKFGSSFSGGLGWFAWGLGGGAGPDIYRNMGGKKPPTKNPKSQKAVMLGCYWRC